MRRFVCLPIAAALVLSACDSTPPPPPPLQPRRVDEVARWEAFVGGTLVGEVVLLEIRDPQGALRFYQIEDAAGRLVGSATEIGRFSRRVPFQEEEEDLGVWSRERGVALLLGCEDSLVLRSKRTAAEASADKH